MKKLRINYKENRKKALRREIRRETDSFLKSLEEPPQFERYVLSKGEEKSWWENFCDFVRMR